MKEEKLRQIEERRLLSLLESSGQKIERGEVFIIKDRCKGCGYCIEFCPKKVLIESKEFNKKGYHYPEVTEEPPLKVCVNCGFCTLICPEFAIYSQKMEEKNNKDGKSGEKTGTKTKGGVK